MSIFVPDEPGLHILLDSPHGPVGRDLERRLIACVSLAKVYASGAPTPLARNPYGRGPRVRTGRLRSSISYVIEQTPTGLRGRYGTSVIYGRFLETVLRDGSTYPFLRPAASAAGGSLV